MRSEILVIDGIHPVTDPALLLQELEYLESRHVSYVLCVMPVYEHADYPAMRQLCEVLRYAQAGNGAVILHAPVIQGTAEEDAVRGQLALTMRNYLESGVIPIGVLAEESQTENAVLMQELQHFSTVLIVPEEEGKLLAGAVPALISGSTGGTIEGPYDGSEEETGDGTVIRVIPWQDGSEAALRQTKVLLQEPEAYQSLWSRPQRVTGLEGTEIVWDGRVLLVNGEKTPRTWTGDAAESSEAFDYQRTIYYRATADLAQQNHVLIGFSILVLAAFLLMIWAARRQMHRRFRR